MAGSRFLALDQSLSSCGFALWDEGDPDLNASGRWILAESVKKRSGGFVDLFRNLVEIQKDRPIDFIVYETPLKLGVDSVDKLIALLGLCAIIETFAKARGIPCQSIAISTWRGTFYSKDERKGCSDLKRLAILRARQLGQDPTTDDQAEAFGILDHFLHVKKINPPWRKNNPFLQTLDIGGE